LCFSIAISLFFTNFSETIPSTDREISVFSTHAFYRIGICYAIVLFELIIPTFNVAYWKQFYIFSIIPSIFIVFISYFYLVESPKFLFYKKDINGTINSLIEMNKFKRSKIMLTEDNINEISNSFYSENPSCYDISNEIIVDATKLSYFENSNYQSIINHEIKIKENNNLTLELKLKNEEDFINNSEKDFGLTDIFNRKFINLTFISSMLFSLGGAISHCNLYYLPIVFFKIAEENKTKDLNNNQVKNISLIELNRNLSKGTSFDEKFSLIFFITQVVTLFGVILGVFLAKKIGMKLTIILNFIPCLIAGFFCCFFTEMILPSASIINFFIVIPLITIKLFIVQAYNTKLRDAGFWFAYFCKTVADCFVPFIINVLINYGTLVPMYYITAVCGIAVFVSIFIPGKHDGMKIK
jgi:hypothetical protein